MLFVDLLVRHVFTLFLDGSVIVLGGSWVVLDDSKLVSEGF